MAVNLSWSDPPPPRGDAGRAFVERAAGAAPPEFAALAERFEFLRELGRGAVGAVYLAHDKVQARLVALKLAPAEFVRSGRLDAEAAAVSRLDHPGVVRLFEMAPAGDAVALVLEYVPGGTLAQRLVGGPFDPRGAATLVALLADAVDAAHRLGIIHRDIKPANVLLTEDGEPKLSDFGLAKHTEGDGSATQTGQLLGTPSYMAPEQARGAKSVGPLADVYGLGAVLYECLTGRPPHRAASTAETLAQVLSAEPVAPRLLNPAVPRDLEAVCLRCLEKSPARRYASAAMLRDDLRRFIDGTKTQARPLSLIGRARRSARRRPAWAALTLVLLLAIVGAASGLLYHNRQISAALGRTDEQRRIARANYRQARDALEKMIAHVEARRSDGVPRLQDLWRRQQEEALAFFQSVASQTDDSDPDVRHDAARAGFEAARLQHALGKSAEAGVNFFRAVDQLETLAAQFPDEPAYRRSLAAAYHGLGVWRQSHDASAEALPCQEKALALRVQLAAEQPTDARKLELAEAEYHVGTCLVILKKSGDAERHLMRAAEMLTSLRDDEGRRRLRADVYLNLSLLLQMQTNRTVDAVSYADKAEADLDHLARLNPNDIRTAVNLAQLRINTGYGQATDKGAATRAAARLALSIAALHDLLRREPESTRVRGALRDCHGATAQFFEMVGDFAAAVSAWEQVVALDDSFTQRLFLAWARARAGDHAKAAQETEVLSRNEKLSPPELYTLGLVWISAMSAPNANDDERGNYARSACAMLKRSLAAMPTDKDRDEARQGFADDPALKPLKDHEEFRKLVAGRQ